MIEGIVNILNTFLFVILKFVWNIEIHLHEIYNFFNLSYVICNEKSYFSGW